MSPLGVPDFPSSLVYGDGTEVRLCPLDRTKGKPIYCAADGRFFSYCFRTDPKTGIGKRRLNEMKPHTSTGHRKRHGVTYPNLSFCSQYYHILMAIVWIGPIPEGHQVDHINGNLLDWSVSNLEYVTPKENIKRARLLRVLRSVGRDPKQMSREELLSIFSKYTFTNPQNLD